MIISVHKCVKKIFTQEAPPTCLEEILQTYEVNKTQTITYKLRDLAGELIKGAFYKGTTKYRAKTLQN